MAAYGKPVGGAWTDSTDYIRRLNQLRRTDPSAVREIERRSDEIYEGYSEAERYSKGGVAKPPGKRYIDSGRDSRARAMEQALYEYERMADVTGAAEGGMLSSYESAALELDEDEGRGGIRTRLASEAERDALARQIATGGVEEAGQSSLEEQIAEVSAPARPFFQEGRDISIQPSPARLPSRTAPGLDITQQRRGIDD